MGLSKRRDAAVSMSTLGDSVGTLGWKSPESVSERASERVSCFLFLSCFVFVPVSCKIHTVCRMKRHTQSACLTEKRPGQVMQEARGDEYGGAGAAMDRGAAEFALGAASDIFSSGLVLFHLLSGARHPFGAAAFPVILPL